MDIKDLKEMKKKLAALSVAGTMAASAVGFGVAEVHADEVVSDSDPSIEKELSGKSIENETIQDDSIKFEGVYDSEKEAQDKASEKEKEYNDKGYENISSDIVSFETKKETGKMIENQVESDIETKEDAYTDLSLEEAENLKEELEVDNHDKKVTVVIKSYQVDSGKDDVLNIEKTFNSEEEANAYIESLKEQGYEITDSQITENTKTEVRNLEAVFDTKEEAEKALKDFEEKYNDVTGEVIQVRNEDKDTKETTTGTVKFDNIEDALKEKENLEKETDTYIVTATIREEKTIEKTETTISSEQFKTQEEALAYIEELKNKGYDVSDLEVKLVSFEESIWKDEEGVVVDPGETDSETFNYGHFDVTLLTSFTKIDAEGNESTVKGTVAVDSVNISGKDVNMTGPSKDPNSGLIEYTSVSRNGLNVTNKSLVKITGTVTYDGKTLPFTVEGYLSESQNVCEGRGNAKGFDLEFKKITIINNKVLVDTNLINMYQVIGTAIQNEEIIEYYVDTETITKGYDYKVSATGGETVKDGTYELTGVASKDIYETKYALDVTTENKKYEYTPEIITIDQYGLTVTADIPVKDIEEPVIDKDDNNKDNNKTVVENKEDETPRTSDDMNLAIPLAMAGASLAGAGIALGRSRKRTIK